MTRTHKIRLVPTVKQEQALNKACGTARYSYNKNLALWNRAYKMGVKVNMYMLKKHWNKRKPNWVYESPKDANIQPVIDLGKAFKSFFKGINNHPRFHKKDMNEGFYISNDIVKWATDYKVQLPKIGKVKTREVLRFQGKIMSYRVKKHADQWYLCVAVEMPDVKKKPTRKIGIDLGVKTLATLSNGKTYPSLKTLKKSATKLAKAQRELSRKKKGSRNRDKARLKVAKVNLRIKNQRHDYLHKVTTDIVENQGNIVCLEDLKIEEMTSKENGKKNLRKSILDNTFGEFRRMIEYKAFDTLTVNTFYPSSQICSNCGNRKKISLSERIYKCEKCSFEIDRDLNASVNILNAAG